MRMRTQSLSPVELSTFPRVDRGCSVSHSPVSVGISTGSNIFILVDNGVSVVMDEALAPVSYVGFSDLEDGFRMDWSSGQ
jgi:hypothetical protein